MEIHKMIYSAYKLTPEQTEYIGHAFVNEEATDDYGKPLPDGKFPVGHIIRTDRTAYIVTELFEGFDFHSLKPRSFFHADKLCWHCHQPYKSTEEYKAKHEGPYGMACPKQDWYRRPEVAASDNLLDARRDARNKSDAHLWEAIGDAEVAAIARPRSYCRTGITWAEWLDILQKEEQYRRDVPSAERRPVLV